MSESIEQQRPDVIILDIRLPGRSGLEFSADLRSQEKHEDQARQRPGDPGEGPAAALSQGKCFIPSSDQQVECLHVR
jgi:CheY-like chemotaxis protein